MSTVVIEYKCVRTHSPLILFLFSLFSPLSHQTMDGELYEHARNAYMLYAQIEADSANLVKADFEDLREQAFLVGVA